MELREQRFGIEIEMTGITRAGAAKVAATYFGTRSEYVGTYYHRTDDHEPEQQIEG